MELVTDNDDTGGSDSGNPGVTDRGTDTGSDGDIDPITGNRRRDRNGSRNAESESGTTGNRISRSEIADFIGASDGGRSTNGSGDRRSDGSGAGAEQRNRKRGRPRNSERNIDGNGSDTEEGARSVRSDNARVGDKPPRRTRSSSAEAASKIAIAATTRELIADSWQAVYWIPAQVTGVREVELTENEADVLTTRTEALIKSLGTKRAKKLLGALDKWAPGVSLAVAVGIITVPKYRAVAERIAFTKSQRQARSNNVVNNANDETRQSAESGTSTNVRTAPSVVDAVKDSRGEYRGEVNEFGEIAITRSDLDILGGVDLDSY